MPTLYRKRLIPDECVNLKNDNIIFLDSDAIVTSWNTFRPKAEFTHGTSYYVINEGFKISKFYKADNSLAYIYCDIIDTSYDAVRARIRGSMIACLPAKIWIATPMLPPKPLTIGLRAMFPKIALWCRSVFRRVVCWRFNCCASIRNGTPHQSHFPASLLRESSPVARLPTVMSRS